MRGKVQPCPDRRHGDTPVQVCTCIFDRVAAWAAADPLERLVGDHLHLTPATDGSFLMLVPEPGAVAELSVTDGETGVRRVREIKVLRWAVSMVLRDDDPADRKRLKVEHAAWERRLVDLQRPSLGSAGFMERLERSDVQAVEHGRRADLVAEVNRTLWLLVNVTPTAPDGWPPDRKRRRAMAREILEALLVKDVAGAMQALREQDAPIAYDPIDSARLADAVAGHRKHFPRLDEVVAAVPVRWVK
jgi:hypothetical protein